MRLIRSITFIIGFLIILHSIKHFLYATVTGVNYDTLGKINAVVKSEITPRVAIFGSSVALTGIDPLLIEKHTGRSCYNFGISGNSMTQYNGVLKEYIGSSESDIIVISGTFDEFDSRNAFYQLYNYVLHLNNENIANGLKHIDKNYIFKLEYIPFYDLTVLNHQFYKYFFKEIFNTEDPDQINEIKGFKPIKNFSFTEPIGESYVASIDKRVLYMYKSLISEANRRGIKVILVLAPIYSATQSKIKNLSKVREAYKALAKGNAFIDLSSSPICSNKSLFYDSFHINGKGVSLVTKEIASHINDFYSENQQ